MVTTVQVGHRKGRWNCHYVAGAMTAMGVRPLLSSKAKLMVKSTKKRTLDKDLLSVLVGGKAWYITNLTRWRYSGTQSEESDKVPRKATKPSALITGHHSVQIRILSKPSDNLEESKSARIVNEAMFMSWKLLSKKSGFKYRNGLYISFCSLWIPESRLCWISLSVARRIQRHSGSSVYSLTIYILPSIKLLRQLSWLSPNHWRLTVERHVRLHYLHPCC